MYIYMYMYICIYVYIYICIYIYTSTIRIPTMGWMTFKHIPSIYHLLTMAHMESEVYVRMSSVMKEGCQGFHPYGGWKKSRTTLDD